MGINYFGHDGREFQPLAGPHNDVYKIHDFLSRHGFSEENIVMLLDHPHTMDSMQSTCKINLEIQMLNLVRDTQPNDSLVFFYSGKSTSWSYSFYSLERLPFQDMVTNSLSLTTKARKMVRSDP